MRDEQSQLPRRSEQNLGAAASRKRTPGEFGREVLAQVGGQGLAYINRQGHPLVKPSLAANKDLSGSPVDVLKLESDHFTGAKTKTSEQKKDSVVASAHRRAAVAGLEHTFDLLRR